MATTPLFIASGFATPCVSITTISTDRTGGGGYTTILNEGPALVNGFRFRAITLTIDSLLLLFYYDGSTSKIIDEIPIRAMTPQSISAGWNTLWAPPSYPFVVPSGDAIKAAIYSGPTTMIIHSQALGGLL